MDRVPHEQSDSAEPKHEARISVSFSVSDNYAQHLAVVAASLLAQTPRRGFVFHVLAKELSEETLARLAQMEAEWGTQCRFVYHPVDRARFDAFPLPLEHITQEMYYRYLLPELLADEDRTLYLDVDVLAMTSVEPLWELELGDALLAGVSDGKKDTPKWRAYQRQIGMEEGALYVNSGVLLMNLAALRAFDFGAKCMALTGQLYGRIAWPDQDVINRLAQGRVLALERGWNCTDPKALAKGERPLIRHFASFSSKPWCNIWKNRTWPAYWRYLRKTPYRDRAWAFVWAHFKGFFYFCYVKKGVERTLVCGLPVRKRVLPMQEAQA